MSAEPTAAPAAATAAAAAAAGPAVRAEEPIATAELLTAAATGMGYTQEQVDDFVAHRRRPPYSLNHFLSFTDMRASGAAMPSFADASAEDEPAGSLPALLRMLFGPGHLLSSFRVTGDLLPFQTRCVSVAVVAAAAVTATIVPVPVPVSVPAVAAAEGEVERALVVDRALLVRVQWALADPAHLKPAPRRHPAVARVATPRDPLRRRASTESSSTYEMCERCSSAGWPDAGLARKPVSTCHRSCLRRPLPRPRRPRHPRRPRRPRRPHHCRRVRRRRLHRGRHPAPRRFRRPLS